MGAPHAEQVAEWRLAREPPLHGPDLIVPAVAEAVGFQFHAGADPKQQLCDYFREKRVLLLMDNFEHVIAGAGFVSELVRAAPGVQVLATVPRLTLTGTDAGAAAGRPVAVRQGPVLATSFHPEITGDLRVHALFCAMVRGTAAAA